MEMYFYYGASVQGIQKFIFNTNKLREIVGASEIVEFVCTDLFRKLIIDNKGNDDDFELLISAAGNIKCIFKNEDLARAVFLEFPYQVAQYAHGLKVSQTIIPFDKNEVEPVNKLEEQLKIQKNKLEFNGGLRLMSMNYSRRTGKPGVDFDKDEVIDSGIKSKLESSSNIKLFKKITNKDDKIKADELPLEIEKLARGGHDSWIAVIHADANSLGNLIQNYGSEMAKNKEFKNFSKAIQEATIQSAKEAFYEVVKDKKNQEGVYPFRPIICAGDDFTAIIRGDLAFEYTIKFLKQFETNSQQLLKEKLPLTGINAKLTSCAGIAFVKESYPFYLAVKLAEDLCKESKKHVKSQHNTSNVTESALAYHKQQDSFVSDFDDILISTYMSGPCFNYFDGPYILSDFEIIRRKVESYHELQIQGNVPSSKLREILDETLINRDNAILMMKRYLSICKHNEAKEIIRQDLETLEKSISTSNTQSKMSKSSLLSILTIENLIYG